MPVLNVEHDCLELSTERFTLTSWQSISWTTELFMLNSE